VIDSERDEAVLETDSPGGRGELVPRYCSLTGFARGVGSGVGVSIRALLPGTSLIVLTRNSRYRIIVLEGGGDRVLVQGGARFPSAAPALLQGATAGGSFLKTGAIEVGLRLELTVGRERIVTSTVRAVEIEKLPSSEPPRPQ
jgi:hypothetical protein